MKEIDKEGKPNGVKGAITGAVRGVQSALETIAGGGVRKEDWSRADRERMSQGKRPKGHPEHPNV